MTDCCAVRGIADHFSRETAQQELHRYRADGPAPTTRALIDAVAAQGVAGAELLDIGAGVGAIHHALLQRGATRAVHVDISADYVDAAREETARLGHADRLRFVTGDFVESAATIPAADVVTLDRVICCYPELEPLVVRSADKARRIYAAVYPRDNWWTRVSIAIMNVVFRLRRIAFRTYLHAPSSIDELLRRVGFERRSVNRTFFWEVAVYRRRAT